jgi:hypothetical protein
MVLLLLFGAVVVAGVGWAVYNNIQNSVSAEDDEAGPMDYSEPDNIVQQPATNPIEDRIQRFAIAISVAEGFGKPGAIPTVYHNPGDLKPPNGSSNYWQGQTGVGLGGHATFANNNVGWAALYKQINLWRAGKSANIFPSFTFEQCARKYAEDWQPWLANVTRELGVKSSNTLGEYFDGKIT